MMFEEVMIQTGVRWLMRLLVALAFRILCFASFNSFWLWLPASSASPVPPYLNHHFVEHHNQEAKKPRSRKAKKPRSQEAEKPRSQEAKKPRSQEAKKPRSQKRKKKKKKKHTPPKQFEHPQNPKTPHSTFNISACNPHSSLTAMTVSDLSRLRIHMNVSKDSDPANGWLSLGIENKPKGEVHLQLSAKALDKLPEGQCGDDLAH